MDFVSAVEDRIAGVTDISDLTSLSERLSTVQATSKRLSDGDYSNLLDSIYRKKTELTSKGV